MIKKHLQRGAALIMAVVLAVSMTGCRKTEEAVGEDSIQKEKQDRETDGGGSSAGRYVEELLDLPYDAKTQYFETIVMDENKTLYIYAADSEGKMTEYTGQPGESFTAGQPEWFNKLVTKDNWWYSDIIYGQDGNFYASYKNESGGFSVARKISDTQAESFSIGQNQPGSLHIGGNGMIVVTVDSQILVFDNQGNRVHTLEAGTNPSEKKITSDVWKNELATMNAAGDAITVYDLETGDIVDEYAFSFEQDIESRVSYDQEGNVYVSDIRGISRKGREDSEFVRILDGQQYSMGMSSYYITDMAVIDKDTIYTVYTDWQNNMNLFCRYTFDANAKQAETVLTIYSLYENEAVSRAVLDYRRQNPEVELQYTAADSEGGATAADKIRALNTEIINGTGPDILLLDGLPMKSYMEKGVLSNMSALAEELVNNNLLLPNIAESFTEKDGIYGIPMRIGVPVMSGEEADLEDILTIDGLKKLVDSGRGEGLLPAVPEDILTMMLVTLYSEELLKDGELQSDKLKSFLTALKALSEAIGTEEMNSELEARYNSLPQTSQRWKKLNMTKSLFSDYANKEARVAFTEFAEGIDMMFPMGIAKAVGFPIKDCKGLYFPYSIAGINSGTAHAEEAQDFIRFMLSAEQQMLDGAAGLPVSPEGLEAFNKHQNNFFAGGTTLSDGTEIMIDWPGEEQIREFTGLFTNLTRPVRLDQVMMEMISNETEAMFAGNQTPEEAAGAIESKAGTYLSE